MGIQLLESIRRYELNIYYILSLENQLKILEIGSGSEYQSK